MTPNPSIKQDALERGPSLKRYASQLVVVTDGRSYRNY